MVVVEGKRPLCWNCKPIGHNAKAWHKSGWHVWKDLDDYRFITLLNTELQILARALTNRLQLVISNLIGPEQNYAVMGRSIQHNLHLVREVLEGLQDNTKTALIYLDQSKAFDRADHLFWKQFWRTRFKPGFCKWMSIMYHNPQTVVPVNDRRSQAFAI